MGNNRLEDLYNQKDYSKILSKYVEFNDYDQEEKIFISFALLEVGSFSKVLDCMNKIKVDEIPSRLKGKYYRYMGLVLFYFDFYDEALENFENGFTIGDQESGLWKRLLFVETFEISKVGNCIFRFVNYLSSFEKKGIIFSCLSVYNEMQEFFEITFEKKINIYVFTQPYDALGNKLSYIDNGFKNIFLYKNDLIGHEIVHLFANSLYPQMRKNHFIDEGIATFFSSKMDYSDYLDKYYNHFIKFDIIEVWGNDLMCPNMSMRDSIYYVAGALIGFLLKEYGKRQLLFFLQDESFENAQKVFGEKFNQQLLVFMKEIGFDQ